MAFSRQPRVGSSDDYGIATLGAFAELNGVLQIRLRTHESDVRPRVGIQDVVIRLIYNDPDRMAE